MKPKQIGQFVERIAGKENLTGAEANSRKLRFGLEGFGKINVFDCDDRAEIARRVATKHGYQSQTRVQHSTKGKVAHRYLVVRDSDGNEHDVLKKPEGY